MSKRDAVREFTGFTPDHAVGLRLQSRSLKVRASHGNIKLNSFDGEEMPPVLRECDGIRYSPLNEEDLDEVAELVGLVFTEGSEPITRVLMVGANEFTRFIKSISQKFTSEGLSIVAREVRTGTLVGAQLNDDMGTEPAGSAGDYGWLAGVLALLTELDSRYFGDRVIEPGRYVHLFFGAVSGRYRGRGIATQLLELSLETARRKGYETAVVEASGLISQRVLRNAGFESRVEIPYAAFEHIGLRPFQGIKDHPSILLMDRDLTR